nr:hypothetical protein [Pseudofrankia asymbiotica]
MLLAEGHDTSHVANARGWANRSHFIAAFTTIIGITPGRYRSGHERGAGRADVTAVRPAVSTCRTGPQGH